VASQLVAFQIRHSSTGNERQFSYNSLEMMSLLLIVLMSLGDSNILWQCLECILGMLTGDTQNIKGEVKEDRKE
jgi:hypothetical protein